MRWEGGRESDNVEDRRGMGTDLSGGGPIVVTGGIGTLIIILLAIVFGIDPQQLFNPQGGLPPAPVGQAAGAPDGAEDELTHLVRVVLADTEDVWTQQFRQMGRMYRDPRLVLFDGGVRSACGFSSAAVGPFYCPPDERVYLDLSFFQQLRGDFQAPGEFAEAYVIAHEIGHHVQNLLGISDRVAAARRRREPATGERAFGAARAASRFPGRRVGPSCRSDAAHSRGW